MGDHGVPSLHYGSLGAISYSVPGKAWTAQREPIRSPRSALLSSSFSVDPSTSAAASTTRIDQIQALRSRARQFPDLVPALPLIHELQKGETGFCSDDSFLARKRRLFARGSARRTKDVHRGLVNYVCFATGVDGNQLALGLVGHISRGWRHLTASKPYAWFQSFETTSSAASIWVCPDGRIQQVSVSESRQFVDHLVAVCSHATLYIFQPGLFSTSRQKIPSNLPSPCRSGQLYHNLLVRVPLSSIMQSPCADIKFNPWCQDVIVASDTFGNPFALELARRQTRHATVQVQPLSNVSTSFGVRQYSHDRDSPHCLALVFWLSIDNFAICGSTSISIFETSNTTVASSTLDLPVAPSESIVDAVLADMFDTQALFLLVSTRILVFKVERTAKGVAIALANTIRHYFKAPEQSMRLAFRASPTNASASLLLYSTTSPMTAEYCLEEPADGSDTFIIPNPTYLPLYDLQGTHQTPPPVSDLVLVPVSLQEKDGFGEDSCVHNVELYQALGLLDSLDSFSSLMVLKPSETSTKGIIPPNWVHVHQPRQISQSHVLAEAFGASGSDSDIILSDWSSQEGDDVGPEEHSKTARVQSQSPSSIHFAGPFLDSWTISNEQIYSAIVRASGKGMIDLGSALTSVICDAPQTNFRPATLFSLLTRQFPQSFFVGDLDKAEEIASSISAGMRATSAQAGSPQIIALGTSQQLGLSLHGPISTMSSLEVIYNGLVRQYIQRLPTSVSPRTRIRLDQLARTTAAALWLSSHKVVYLPNSEALSPRPIAEENENGNDEIDAASSLDTAHPPYLVNQSSPETVSLSQPGIYTLGSSQDPDVESTPAAADATASLSEYTDWALLPAISKAVLPILSQWEIGSDPREYQPSGSSPAWTDNHASAHDFRRSYETRGRRSQDKTTPERSRSTSKRRLSQAKIGPSSGLAVQSQAAGPPSQSAGSHLPPMQSQPTLVIRGDRQKIPPLVTNTTASQPLQGRYGSRSHPGNVALRGKRKAGF